METWEQFNIFMQTRKSRGEIIDFFVENYKVKKTVAITGITFLISSKILVVQDVVFYVINK